MKKALITGITGQDGSYLAELLIEKGYSVCGLIRRSSTFNTQRIDHIIEFESEEKFRWQRADLTDAESISRVLRNFEPDEIYHLGAQSHVGVSFEVPTYTLEVAAVGTLRLFDAVRSQELDCAIYNASSSEMYGSSCPPQDENTVFSPQSPYAVGKVAAHQMGALYRDAYNMKIYNGILFNHESPRRGETFVTRKITRAVSRIAYGIQEKVTLGNLNSKRDWGYAPEYVEAMWKMLQSNKPDDYVIATGESHSVREFVELSFKKIGVTIEWAGEGVDEKGTVVDISKDSKSFDGFKLKVGDIVVEISEYYFRPAEVDYLLGDPSKAQTQLDWKPRIKFEELANIMVNADLEKTKLILDGTRQASEEWRQYII